MKVSAIWTRQPTDDVVQAEWAECLSRVEFQDALEAVRAFRNNGNVDPPTPGQVWREAQDMGDRRARLEVSRRQQIDGPAPTQEQVEAGRRTLRDMIDKLGKKLGV